MIKLFDSLAHPTITGDWLGRGIDSSFKTLTISLKNNGFIGACAIGMHNIEGYNHEEFISRCSDYPNLYPVAGFDPHCLHIEKEIKLINKLGFIGIKIHPRFSELNYSDNNIDKIFYLAGKYNLTVFYCTYAHCGGTKYPNKNPFYFIAEKINNNPNTRVILVHGGDVELLKYAEFVRHNKNTLLDLSLTFMKYKGSSIDKDIEYLFKKFDQRICIGTDHPEYNHKEVYNRFKKFSKNLSGDKIENISHKNILNFIKKSNNSYFDEEL